MIFIILITFTFIIITLYYIFNKSTKIKEINNVHSMFIFGSGGHTAEMLQLIKSLDPTNTFDKVHFVLSNNDKLTLHKISTINGNNISTHLISRSRSVGQSWFTTIFTFAISTLQSIILIIRTRPHLVIANGPGTCVPICLASKLLPGKRIVIFVESICRVKTLSLSGKILYPIVDKVVVQWPKLTKLYPKAEYLGTGLI